MKILTNAHYVELNNEMQKLEKTVLLKTKENNKKQQTIDSLELDNKQLLEKINSITDLAHDRYNEIDKLTKLLRKQFNANGGLKSSNNRKIKNNEILSNRIKELDKLLFQEKEISETKDKTINKLIKDNKEQSVQINKLQGIIDNLNKILKGKIRPIPTSNDIINYDKKDPRKK